MRKAFTLIELLVVVSIVALLVALLLPSLGKARQAAHNVVCQTNLQQQGLAYHMYASDNKSFGPFEPNPAPATSGAEGGPGMRWMIRLAPYLQGPTDLVADFNSVNAPNKRMGVFQCPATWNKYVVWGPNSYGPNTYLTTEPTTLMPTDTVSPMPLNHSAAIRNADQLVLIAESLASNQILEHWQGRFLWDHLHMGRRNYLLADDRVQNFGNPRDDPDVPRLFFVAMKNGGERWGYNNHNGFPGPYPPFFITIFP